MRSMRDGDDARVALRVVRGAIVWFTSVNINDNLIRNARAAVLKLGVAMTVLSKTGLVSLRISHTVWASIHVSKTTEKELRYFLTNLLRIEKRFIKSGLHVTLYHARRPLAGLEQSDEDVRFQVASEDLRFMVMAPGGENPRPDVDPSASAIGLRIRRSAPIMAHILRLRARFYKYETSEVLGVRKPSDARRSAFGARHFQPHLTLLKPGCALASDLTAFGRAFEKGLVRSTSTVCRLNFGPIHLPPNQRTNRTVVEVNPVI